MKSVLLALIVGVALISTLGISMVNAQEVSEIAEESDYTIPPWIKGIAAYWVDDNLVDAEFRNAMEYLIQQGIFVIESVRITETTLSDEEERLYQLEIAQRDDRITILKDELEDTGKDNAILLQSIVEKDQIIKQSQTSLKNVKSEFETYKEDYPLKVGYIGGKLVNADTIRELEQQIKELEQINDELKSK